MSRIRRTLPSHRTDRSPVVILLPVGGWEGIEGSSLRAFGERALSRHRSGLIRAERVRERKRIDGRSLARLERNPREVDGNRLIQLCP